MQVFGQVVLEFAAFDDPQPVVADGSQDVRVGRGVAARLAAVDP
jgi:hypothetical protein